jgi:hypothetical protein
MEELQNLAESNMWNKSGSWLELGRPYVVTKKKSVLCLTYYNVLHRLVKCSNSINSSGNNIFLLNSQKLCSGFTIELDIPSSLSYVLTITYASRFRMVRR